MDDATKKQSSVKFGLPFQKTNLFDTVENLKYRQSHQVELSLEKTSQVNKI